MSETLLIHYLKSKGQRFNDLNEFWCFLMNETKGRIAGALLNEGITDLMQLKKYLKGGEKK